MEIDGNVTTEDRGRYGRRRATPKGRGRDGVLATVKRPKRCMMNKWRGGRCDDDYDGVLRGVRDVREVA